MIDNLPDWIQAIGSIIGIVLVYLTFNQQQKITLLNVESSIKENTPLFVLQTQSNSSDTKFDNYEIQLRLERNDAYKIEVDLIWKPELSSYISFQKSSYEEGLTKDSTIKVKFKISLDGLMLLRSLSDEYLELYILFKYQDISKNKYYQKVVMPYASDHSVLPPVNIK